MQWWQHPAELNVAHHYMMATLPSIQWQNNPPSDTVHVQWPEWQRTQDTSKITIHSRPESDTKLQYVKYFTSLPIVVLKNYGSSINAVADLGLMNGIQLAARAKTVHLSTLSSQLCPTQLPVFSHTERSSNVKLTTHLHLMLMLQMHGISHPLPICLCAKVSGKGGTLPCSPSQHASNNLIHEVLFIKSHTHSV